MSVGTSDIKIIVHMAASLDGFVASHDNSVSWLETSDTYDKGTAGEDPETFLQRIDCYVMGSHTYEHARKLSQVHGWPYGEKPTIVLTHRHMQSEMAQIEFYGGELSKLVNEKLKPRYRTVWVAGGPIVADSFIREGLADEVRITILPILLGRGTPYFKESKETQPMHLKDVIAYKNGLVELVYQPLQNRASSIE